MLYLFEETQFAASPGIYWHDQTRQRSWKARLSPRGFRLVRRQHHPDHDAQRWKVDTLEDLALLRQIYTRFELRNDLTWLEVLALLQREPGLASLNRACVIKITALWMNASLLLPHQGLKTILMVKSYGYHDE